MLVHVIYMYLCICYIARWIFFMFLHTKNFNDKWNLIFFNREKLSRHQAFIWCLAWDQELGEKNHQGKHDILCWHVLVPFVTLKTTVKNFAWISYSNFIDIAMLSCLLRQVKKRRIKVCWTGPKMWLTITGIQHKLVLQKKTLL